MTHVTENRSSAKASPKQDGTPMPSVSKTVAAPICGCAASAYRPVQSEVRQTFGAHWRYAKMTEAETKAMRQLLVKGSKIQPWRGASN